LLKLENLRLYVPALCGDARRPVHLLEAGLRHPECAGVVAITNVNETNLKIAITAKLLHPDTTVICRADSHDIEDNMASFGTDHIYDPFDTFALHLATALQAPGLYLLHEWLTGTSRQPLPPPVYPPHQGLWILCGYGRFGKAVASQFEKGNVPFRVIEAQPDKTGAPADTVFGRGTEAPTLEEAGITGATGIVAGTDNDTNNLSIVVTAQELNPDLFTVARQNRRNNRDLFLAAGVDLIMERTDIMAGWTSDS